MTDLLAEHWNERCEPPWSRDELVAFAVHAETYAQTRQGSGGVRRGGGGGSPGGNGGLGSAIQDLLKAVAGGNQKELDEDSTQHILQRLLFY